MIVNGQFVDGRASHLRKPACEHDWQNTHSDSTYQYCKCSLCRRTKKRRLPKGNQRSYRPRMKGIGVNVSGIPFQRNKNLMPLPVALRGFNTKPR